MTWVVLCDFDHTITTEDVTDTLLEKFALPQWREIEALWESGAIGSRACMEQQVALLRASKEAVDTAADAIHIDPHFKAFASLCEKKNVPMMIVSDGLDYVIRHILAKNGIHHISVIAGHLEYSGGNRWQFTSPFAKADCSSQASTCKCALAEQVRNIAHAENILYIGDGRSDFCVSLEEADMILAKDSLLAFCQKQQLPHKSFTSFAQASRILESLIQREPPAEAEERLYA